MLIQQEERFGRYDDSTVWSITVEWPDLQRWYEIEVAGLGHPISITVDGVDADRIGAQRFAFAPLTQRCSTLLVHYTQSGSEHAALWISKRGLKYGE